jgi:T4 RnlA family RNA ligase
MSKLQEYLRAGNSPESLTESLGIKVKNDRYHSNLYLFSYSQIDSPKGDPIVTCSRGTILDADDDWNIVCRPFDRFFNSGEGTVADIDWNTARVFKKEDGSLVSLYKYDGAWRIATKGVADGSGEMGRTDITFNNMFWQIFQDNDYFVPSSEYDNFTFCFEICTPHNRVVVPHTTESIKLLAVRNNETGEELDVSVFNGQYPVVESYPIDSLPELFKTFDDMDPIRNEGYVVCDSKFNRMKVKHPGYVALHHLRSRTSLSSFIDLVRFGETSEFLSVFPEYTSEFEEISLRYNNRVKDIVDFYSSIKDVESQKDFAKAVQASNLIGANLSFTLRKSNSGRNLVSLTKEIIRGMPSKTVMRLLNYSK